MRRNGTTTRIIDACVQELFKTGKTTVIDHYPTREASVRAFEILIDRLMREHGGGGELKDYIADRNRLTIIKFS